jgi:methyl coenzyme M reductase subunit D
MKFEQGIEVSGIEKVVIDRRFVWKRTKSGPGCRWFLEKGGPDNKVVSIAPEKMEIRIKLMVMSPKRRAWVHGDTINIVRRDRK